MKAYTILAVLLVITGTTVAQTVPLVSNYPDTLWAETDTFHVMGDGWPEPWAFATTEEDTVDLGTDGYPGMRMKVWTTTDTLTVQYVNSPLKQWLYLPVASPSDTVTYRLRFNPQFAVYSEKYIDEHQGEASWSIPETYELANVILRLSACSEQTGNRPESEYANKVLDHFSSFKTHPLITILNKRCSQGNPFQTYYNFRENSICYRFEEGELVYDEPYAHVRGNENEVQGGMFRELAYLVQDFAAASHFRKFYQDNRSYYQALEQREQELMPVREMWRWLEKEFPIQIQSYQIIFSPLIGGAHSTQKFHHGSFVNSKFKEVVMFVSSTELVDRDSTYTEQQKEGLTSGIVFTEIDHNYVNPTTSKHQATVDSLLADLTFWATEEALANYESAYEVFNEYMTHAVFCLYVQERYPAEVADFVIQERKALMDKRGFKQFNRFNEIILTTLRKDRRKKPIADYYSEILAQLRKIS